MTIALLLIGDGRDEYHDRAIASLNESVPVGFEFSSVVKIDDRDHELGFAGAIAAGWAEVAASRAEWVFHLEADFTFHQTIAFDRMVAVLKRRPYLAQLVLKRQPWNESERAAGGIVEQCPADFRQVFDRGDLWTEHRRFFSTNPCLYSAALCRQGWPQIPESEGIMTHRLLADPDLRFAFWGGKFDAPLVEHIGQERTGVGY